MYIFLSADEIKTTIPFNLILLIIIIPILYFIATKKKKSSNNNLTTDILNNDLPLNQSTDENKKCPFCAEEININAIKCKHCGEFVKKEFRVNQKEWNNSNQKEWNPGTAALLSLIIPGAGQIYKGRLGVGFIWLIIVPLGYILFIVPGVVLHITCVFNAYNK